jgi:hypothetical protein
MGIKEKLPLLNSEKKATRIAGYVVYAFVVLIVLGAILPSPDTGGETGTTTTAATAATTDESAATGTADKEKEIDPNLEWMATTYVSMGYIVEDMQAVSTAAEDMDIDEVASRCSDLKAHVQVAKRLNNEYEVSSELATAKYEWGGALDDYERAAEEGYNGAKNLDPEALEKASLYMTMGNKHIEKATAEIDRYSKA